MSKTRHFSRIPYKVGVFKIALIMLLGASSLYAVERKWDRCAELLSFPPRTRTKIESTANRLNALVQKQREESIAQGKFPDIRLPQNSEDRVFRRRIDTYQDLIAFRDLLTPEALDVLDDNKLPHEVYWARKLSEFTIWVESIEGIARLPNQLVASESSLAENRKSYKDSAVFQKALYGPAADLNLNAFAYRPTYEGRMFEAAWRVNFEIDRQVREANQSGKFAELTIPPTQKFRDILEKYSHEPKFRKQLNGAALIAVEQHESSFPKEWAKIISRWIKWKALQEKGVLRLPNSGRKDERRYYRRLEEYANNHEFQVALDPEIFPLVGAFIERRLPR